MVIADIEEIMHAIKVLAKINNRRVRLKTIKWVYKGVEIDVSDEFRKHMIFTGLNPTDFVLTIKALYGRLSSITVKPKKEDLRRKKKMIARGVK